MNGNTNVKKIEEYFFEKRNADAKFLYKCPHCGDSVYESDTVTAVEGYAYCPECIKPIMPKCKSLNLFLAKRAPTNEELFEMASMEEFE